MLNLLVLIQLFLLGGGEFTSFAASEKSTQALLHLRCGAKSGDLFGCGFTGEKVEDVAVDACWQCWLLEAQAQEFGEAIANLCELFGEFFRYFNGDFRHGATLWERFIS